MDKTKWRKVLAGKILYLKYAGIIFLVLGATAVSVGADFYNSLKYYINGCLSEIPLSSEIMSGMNQVLYSKIVVFLVVAAALSLLAAYKIFSPVYKLKKAMKKVENGNIDHKMNREKNETYLSGGFNDMMDSIRKRRDADIETVNKNLSELEGLQEKIIEDDIKEDIERVKENLTYVKNNWRGKT
ncbi:MAG: HAMP domain-containing protein [Elusimicrobiota bacterium]